MDRIKLVRDCVLLTCAALTAGCGSRATSSPAATSRQTTAPRFEQRTVAREPRLLPDVIRPTGFQAGELPASGSVYATQVAPPSPAGSFVADNDRFESAATEGELTLPDFEPSPAATEVAPADQSTPTPDDKAPIRWVIQTPPEPVTSPVAPPVVEAPLPSPVAEPVASGNIPSPMPQAHRSAEMDTVARDATVLVQQGLRLAERDAIYSARKKFFEALGIVAHSLDLETHTNTHMRALIAGRTALQEARDFVDRGSPSLPDMKRIVAGHRTQILNQIELAELSPIVAQQHYYTFAQDQLTLATGNEPVGSMALFSLGKIAPQLRRASGSRAVMGEQMAYYQAALAVDANNFRAANELGIILGNNGRLETARDLFIRSLKINDQASTWYNLSVMHRQLGEIALAEQASQRASLLRRTRMGEVTGDNVRWVDPSTFVQSVPPSEGLIPPATAAAAPKPSAPAPAAKKRTAQWPWNRESRR